MGARVGEGFSVELGAMDELAASWSRVADLLKALDVAGPFDPVSTALPGSRTASAAAGTAVRLGAAVRVLGDHADELAARARRSAEEYRSADSGVADRYARLAAS